MPVYDFVCEECGATREVMAPMGAESPTCHGAIMRRTYGSVWTRDSKSLTGKINQLFINRMDDIHKRQADRGERLRWVHPSEVVR